MLSVLKTPPTSEPVTLADAKEYLRVDANADDNQISAMIKAATRKVEAHIDRKLISQEWEIYFDRFPNNTKDQWWDGVVDGAIAQFNSLQRWIDLPFGKMISLTSFETFDDESTVYTANNSDFIVDSAGPHGRVALKRSAVWPQTILRPINGIRITGVFGYADPTLIPGDIILAIKIWVAALYEHRGDEDTVKPPTTALSLLEQYRHLKVPRG